MSELEHGTVKPRTNNSIWIAREGKRDLYGAIQNAGPSTKNDSGFTLQKGDVVSFKEGRDGQDRPTALEITLAAKGETMNDNNSGKGNNQNQNQKNQNQNQQPRVFVDFPDGDIISSKKKDHYQITVKIGQTPMSGSSIRARVFVVNGEKRQQVKSVDVLYPLTHTLPELKLDFDQPVIVEVEKVGFANSKDAKDWVEIPKPGGKPSGGEAKEMPKRFNTKFMSFAQGNAPNFVRVYKTDTDFKPCAGKVEVFLGQNGSVNGQAPTNGIVEVDVPADGSLIAQIVLQDSDGVVIFTDPVCGESKEEFLRKAR